ncbi:HAD family phosphatase [Fulvivirgaceae bacterium BMA10]|uniref:HAD family phosphatase n=1 Tax=Splendidivirga corallicola TaxID=3051826 RepID=A0ABT8KM23_9BACT|nr:HAD family phosphatase [Fulvivirgaceae bacterium BMA10]
MKLDKIKNFIFDLGGVIINLDVPATYKKFSEFTGVSQEDIANIVHSTDVFLDYEKGKISSELFRDGVRDLVKNDISDQLIDEAWLAMLQDIPVERLDLVKRLNKNFKTFILSNTNEIHIQEFHKIVDKGYGLENFRSIFNKVYYSYEMGKRKPDAEIFEQVLEENNLVAEETLFIEDSSDNIKAAEALGISTYHVPSNQLDLSYFTNGILKGA